MTDSAVLDEMFVGFGDHVGSLLLTRIHQGLSTRRRRNPTGIPRHRSLHPRRLLTGTESFPTRVQEETAN